MSGSLPDPGHLARRFVTSLSRRAPAAADESWARRWLSPAEVELWRAMSNQDRRHSVQVARRFADLRADEWGEAEPPSAEMAGALLHDVGKTVSSLGTFSRVVATVVGPRTERFRWYHDHEPIGAALAGRAGSHPVTIALINGHGPTAAATALRAADTI
ncbi:hypothetical protein BH24ACT5_BH24ACT5_20850 [soil metagenome]